MNKSTLSGTFIFAKYDLILHSMRRLKMLNLKACFFNGNQLLRKYQFPGPPAIRCLPIFFLAQSNIYNSTKIT